MPGERISVSWRMTPELLVKSEGASVGIWPKPFSHRPLNQRLVSLAQPATPETPSRRTRIANWSRIYADTTKIVRVMDIKKAAAKTETRIVTEGEWWANNRSIQCGRENVRNPRITAKAAISAPLNATVMNATNTKIDVPLDNLRGISMVVAHSKKICNSQEGNYRNETQHREESNKKL